MSNLTTEYWEIKKRRRKRMREENFYEEIVQEVRRYVNEKESGLFVKLNTMWEHGIVKRKYLTIVGDDDNDNLRYPSVNLYEYYKQYKNGTSKHSIVQGIISILLLTPAAISIGAREMILNGKVDFENVSGRIVYRLINCKRNKEYLKHVPCICMGDIAMIFSIDVSPGNGSSTFIDITNELIECWDVSPEAIAILAINNTQSNYKAKIKNLDKYLSDILGFTSKDEVEYTSVFAQLDGFREIKPINAYAVTNEIGVYGAGVVLYESVLTELTDIFNDDLTIIFSSVHEAIVMPVSLSKGSVNDKFWAETIKKVNETVLNSKDILSNKVYYYDRKTKTFK